jgi:hypothetical protein
MRLDRAGLEEMVIAAVDQRDANVRIAQGFGGCQATESSTQDDDVRLLLAEHLYGVLAHRVYLFAG